MIDDSLVAAGASGQTSVDGGFDVSPETVFRIGSITKVLNLVLQFNEETTEEEYRALFEDGFASNEPLAAMVECNEIPVFVVEAPLGSEGRFMGMQVTRVEDFEEQVTQLDPLRCPAPSAPLP